MTPKGTVRPDKEREPRLTIILEKSGKVAVKRKKAKKRGRR